MSAAGGQPDDDSIGELFGRLIDDGGELVRAEIGLYRELAYSRLLASRGALILAAAAILLAFGSAAALMVGLVIVASMWIGPLGAIALVTIVGLATAALLLRAAVRRIAPKPEVDRGDAG